MPSAILVNYEYRDSLVALFTRGIPSAVAYYLLVSERNLENPHCKNLASWLRAEATEVRNKLNRFEETFPLHLPMASG